VMVGANATVMHASADYGNCAGVYSTTSYVSVGDSAVVGGAGCSPTSEPQPPGPVPVPVSGTNALLLAGLGLMAFGRRRRFKKAA
jgi:hypothetical protein